MDDGGCAGGCSHARTAAVQAVAGLEEKVQAYMRCAPGLSKASTVHATAAALRACRGEGRRAALADVCACAAPRAAGPAAGVAPAGSTHTKVSRRSQVFFPYNPPNTVGVRFPAAAGRRLLGAALPGHGQRGAGQLGRQPGQPRAQPGVQKLRRRAASRCGGCARGAPAARDRGRAGARPPAGSAPDRVP